MSPEDLDYTVRTVMSEEPTLEGRIAVAHAINNRVKAGKYGKSHKDVVLANGQFEPWAYAGSGHKNDPFRHDERGQQYKEVAEIVKGVVDGSIPDPTGGAVNFYAPHAQAALGRKPPKWAQTMEHKGDFGQTKFYGHGKDSESPWMDQSDDAHSPWIENEKEFFEPAVPQDKFVAPSEPQAPAEWGPGRAILHGMLLGRLPQAEAMLETRSLTGGPEYRARQHELEAARKQYHAAHPFQAPLLEAGGSLAGTAFPMAGAGRLGGMALREAGAEGLASFLAGKKGLPSILAQGALQGGAQGALTSELNPEGEGVGGSALRGAAGGAAMNALLGPVIAKVAQPFEEHVNKNLADLALRLNAKYGLGLRKTQLGGKGSALEGIDLLHIPHEMNQAQVEHFNKVLADRVGASDLTKAGIEQAKNRTGQLLDDIASRTNMNVGPGFHGRLMAIARDAQATMTDPKDLAKVMRTLGTVYQETLPGQLSGKRFRDLTYSGGVIANDLLNSGVPKLQQIGKALRREMFDNFHVSNPQLAPVYDKARQNYRELLAIAPHADASGLINPKKLLSTVQRRGITGELEELAQGGKFLPESVAGQAKQTHAPKTGHMGLTKGAELGAGAALGFDALSLLANSPHHLGIVDWAMHNPLYAVPAGLGMGLKTGSNALLGAMVRNPQINRWMLEGKGKGIGTVLRQGASALGGEAGAQTGLRK